MDNNFGANVFTCEYCGKLFNVDWRKYKKGVPRFCSKKCSSGYSRKRMPDSKELECPTCHVLFRAPTSASNKSLCPSCGALKQAEKRREPLYPENTLLGKFVRSGSYIQKTRTLELLGFDFDNPNVESEFLKVQKFLVNEYELKHKSSDAIEKELGLYQGALSYRGLDLFGIVKRSQSDSVSLSFMNADPQARVTSYDAGYHTDWQGNSHYLRSSFEFDLARDLDSRKVKYETEVIRIRYFDTQKGIFRTGVPDFYLPDYSMIIEVKSSYFYDYVNLQDREKELRRLGFKFVVCLDKTKIIESSSNGATSYETGSWLDNNLK